MIEFLKVWLLFWQIGNNLRFFLAMLKRVSVVKIYIVF
nr:MAG TPA: hypothetical protein [Caudoviricetes sp.]